jgi:hypothetical protein
MAVRIAASRGYGYNPHIAVRAAVALVITTAIFDKPLFGPRPAVTREQIVDELTSLLAHGLTQRP